MSDDFNYNLSSKPAPSDPKLDARALRRLERPSVRTGLYGFSRGPRRPPSSGNDWLLALLVFLGTAALSIAVYGTAAGRIDLTPWKSFGEALLSKISLQTAPLRDQLAAASNQASLAIGLPRLSSEISAALAPAAYPDLKKNTDAQITESAKAVTNTASNETASTTPKTDSAARLAESANAQSVPSTPGAAPEKSAQTATIEAPLKSVTPIQDPFAFGQFIGNPLAVPSVGPPSPFPKFDSDLVLSDFQSRISPEFRISPNLRSRVAFWFDVYSKWDSDKRIIHDSRHPWIVYKVVDIAPIIYASTPPHRWLRNVMADKLVKSETARVRSALAKFARRKNLLELTPEEQELVAPLKALHGDIASAARAAQGQVRIQTGQRDFFVSGLVASPRYLGTMEKIFEAHGLPKELTRLPFVESSFNKGATSKVGASGIWQLMGVTGGKFLIVDSGIDERRSPYKATDAAARVLKEDHLILHRSWPLAVTAWNHGPPGVRKAVATVRSQDLGVILERYHTKHFDFASSNFFCEFLAAVHAEYYKDVVFGPLDTEPVLQSFFIALPRPFRSGDLVRMTGLSKAEFVRLNPDLDRALSRNAAVPRGYRLHIPSEIKETVESALATKTTASGAKNPSGRS